MRYWIAVIFLCAVAAFGQTPEREIPKIISTGVVNGKATKLVKPAFPAAARAVRACGAVNVQVTIDHDGTVVEADAVSGHPLLRAAAVAAARESKFSPTLLSGTPVKVTGIIIYNFACPMSILSIGYELSSVERGGSDIAVWSAVANLPEDWDDEIAEMKLLDAKPARNQPAPSQTGQAVLKTAEPQNGTTATTQADDRTKATIAKDLIGKIENRLYSDPTRLWSFRIGVVAARIRSDVSDPERFSESLAELAAEIDRAPANVAGDVRRIASELLDLARAKQSGEPNDEAIKAKSLELKSVRTAE